MLALLCSDIGVVGVLDKVEDFIRATLKEQLPGSVAWIDWAMTYRHPYVDHLDLPLMNPLHVIVIAIGYVVSVQVCLAGRPDCSWDGSRGSGLLVGWGGWLVCWLSTFLVFYS